MLKLGQDVVTFGWHCAKLVRHAALSPLTMFPPTSLIVFTRRSMSCFFARRLMMQARSQNMLFRTVLERNACPLSCVLSSTALLRDSSAWHHREAALNGKGSISDKNVSRTRSSASADSGAGRSFVIDNLVGSKGLNK